MNCTNCGKPYDYNIHAESNPDIEMDRAVIQKDSSIPTHFNATMFLAGISGLISLGLVIALYVTFLPQEDTHPLVFITGGFLIALFAWQIQVVYRIFRLRKHYIGGFVDTKPRVDIRSSSIAKNKLAEIGSNSQTLTIETVKSKKINKR